MGEKGADDTDPDGAGVAGAQGDDAPREETSGDAGDGHPGGVPTEIDILGRHASFREKVTHEDNLINQRKTWLLLSQTFLFGALVLLLTSDKPLEKRDLITLLLIVVGLASALSALLGVWGAWSASRQTRKRWLSDKNPINKEIRKQLPAITGGKDGKFASGLGWASGFTLPVVLLVVWVVLLGSLPPGCHYLSKTWPGSLAFSECGKQVDADPTDDTTGGDS